MNFRAEGEPGNAAKVVSETMDRPLVIVGGGLAGALAALRLAAHRPELPFLLVEASDRIGGDHIWSFFDSDVPAATRDVVKDLQPVRWPRHRVRFSRRERHFAVPYNSVHSSSLDTLVRSRIDPARLRFGAKVERIEADRLVLSDGGIIAARAVIDARGPQSSMPGLELGWQKFVGIEFAAAYAEPDCPVVMDATVPQIGGYRFVYVLPFAQDRVLVEDTYYSNTPELSVEDVAARVVELAAQRGISGPQLRREKGILPILIGGDPDAFWPASDPVARLGIAGGFFHPVTGYSFGLALQLAEELATLPGDLAGPDVAQWSRSRFMAHWREGRFFRMLNRMLFHAAAPDQRDSIFEHFYRLPPDLIARFYAGNLKWSDRARILSGKPPVPVIAALRAIAQR